MIVGRPELGLDRLSKRRARERATILPPALVEERRSERHLGQLRAKPETDQQSRGIWSDINSGTDLGKPTRLFVDLYIKTSL